MTHGHAQPGEPHPQNEPDVHGHGHESKDVKLRGILQFTVVLVIATIAIQLVIGIWMAFYANEEKQVEASRSPRLADSVGQFPDPRLQGNPGAEMARFLKAERQELNAYGWRDRKAGIARIPIDRAMEGVVAQGLPVRKSEEGSSK